MSVTVGTLSVDLVANTASYQSDLGKAGTQTRSTTQGMLQSFQNFAAGSEASTGEVRRELMLLGEEAGVRVPREIAGLIASFGPLASVIDSAFAGIAIVGLIQLATEAVNKFEEWHETASKLKDSFDELKLAGTLALQKVNDETLTLTAQLDSLNGNTLKALSERLQGINNQSLENIRTELESLQDKAMGDLSQGKSSFFGAFFGDSSNAAIDSLLGKLKEAKKEINDLATSGDTAGIRSVLQDELAAVQAAEKLPGISQKSLDAMLALQSSLEQQLGLYQQINAQAVLRGQVDVTQDLASGQKDLNDLLQQMDAMNLAGHDQSVVAITNEPSNIISTLNSLMAGMTDPSNPFNGATDTAKMLEALKTSAVDASNETNRVGASIETVNEKLADQQSILQQLNALYHETNGMTGLSDAQFNKAMKDAQNAAYGLTGAWQNLGNNIGNVIEQAATMGESWHDAAKAILIDIGEVIFQMTVLKSLQESTGGTGVGGFLTDILSGVVSHHATGGYIPPGGVGIAGENGPELLYGGTTGMTVMPMPQGGGKATHVSVNYYTDARGADPSVLQRLPAALKQTENNAVARAVQQVSEIQKRR